MGTRPGGFRPAGRPAGARRDNSPRAPIAAPPVALPPISRTITLAEGMTVKDLSDKLDVRVKDVLKVLLERRMMMNINSAVDIETAREVARTFGAEVETRSFEEELQDVAAESVDAKDQVTRAPVVTVMGHVDHGKTTLLDSIRTTRVAEREAGGITQHIGAYLVGGVGEQKDKSIVFLDTPGHEAFTLMRARGAKVTDVVILVVAADDGVMPQTREAIDHAKAAGVPIIVAVNKIDKPGANPETVKRQLSDLGLMPEAWGGTTVFVEVSAKQKTNLELLLEMILLVTEIGELKANPKRSALGTVLETKLDRGRGPVATVLVQDGTLNVGDNIIAGPVVGRVRALIDDRGRPAKSAGPSTPVEVLGLETLPSPGDSFQSVADPAKARQIAMFRQARAKEKALGRQGQPAHAGDAPAADGRGRREGPADHRQGRRAGLGRGARQLAGQAVGRQGEGQGHPLGGGRHQRVGRAAGHRQQRHHHRLQRAAGSQRRRRRRAREGRHPPSLGHLHGHRGDPEGDGRHARADLQGSAAGRGPGPRHLQGAEGRHHRRLHGASTAASPARATRRCGCCATTSWCGKASWPRCAASRTTSAR